MDAAQQQAVKALTKGETPENAQAIETLIGAAFEAVGSLQRIADAIEKLVSFKGID